MTDPTPESEQRSPGSGTEMAACIAVCELAGIVPALLTAEDVATWYANLELPDRKPPDWTFGPVWTVLYALMGVAFCLVRRERESPERTAGVLAFLLQLALNVAWTLIFFGRHSILGGLATILGLWVGIAATIAVFARVRPLAAALLVPYLLWVTFAVYLNGEIWRLNR